MTTDPYDLERFVHAQQEDYNQVVSELRAGRKTSHWMWYIFPQFDGLGQSAMSRRYAIRSADEARAYLAHPVLGARLRECAALVRDAPARTAREIFGTPDDLKLRSSMTLFALLSAEAVFSQVLEKYFDGIHDDRTVRTVV